MNKFESELKKGHFMISKCENCKKFVWPPSDYCNKCFSITKWQNMEKIGTLIEFSKKDDRFFGIVEFQKQVRVLGTLNIPKNSIKSGQSVKLYNCNYENGPNFTFVSC